ncbi:hypothetical protein TIFTF001_030221 [Ficus carica]|uniref:Uncharacterized protein n=1 Tax=Ficus carica TaxID=3494 RepID=A0AA88DX67_FICCA|nr:hypothetical protein TIFTF001_030221 [Ficus carica]
MSATKLPVASSGYVANSFVSVSIADFVRQTTEPPVSSLIKPLFIFKGPLNRYTVNPTWVTMHLFSPVLLAHPCLAPAPESRLLSHRRPCDAVSGSVACAPIPSSICCLAVAPFTGPPSSLPFAYIVDLLS